MTRFLVASLLLAMLAACGNSTEPVSAANEAQAANVKPVAVAAVPAFFYAPLPPEVGLDMPVHFRWDQINTRPDGGQSRDVRFEYLEGDQRSVMDSLVASFSKAGYKASKEQVENNGNLRVIFYNREKRFTAVTAVVYSKAPDRPSNPKAKGFFSLYSQDPAPAVEQAAQARVEQAARAQ